MTVNLFGKQVDIKKWQVIAAAAVLTAAAGITGVIISKSGGQVIIEKPQQQAADSTVQGSGEAGEGADKKPGQGDTDKEDDEIKVYVTGCVKSPGIVTLKKGQLIDDAVKAAGGFTEAADTDNINLVYKLTANVTLKVNPKNPVKPAGENKPAAIGGQGKNVETKSEAGGGVTLIKNSGGAILNENTSDNSGEDMVNINTATAEQLTALPGIGESSAGDIVAFREKNGPFKTIQDIMRVPGIKEGKFNKIKDRITVD
ncbi:MAG: ComEA family DNA-binding protein [Clostridiales bacterium]|jgi:competence protein ComEA|nr:ComEA family DNA-binding protein [Eubacteriales bacterium]MDH7565551.1 ComEA family DNA-binding protein [Clostridiales bacterium]